MKDKQILTLFFKRDERAIAAAQEAYESYCMKLALNVLENRQDAEECVNDAFHKAWNAIPPAEPKDLGAYLARLTRNTALDRRRTDGRIKRGGRAEAVLSELSELVSGAEGPEDAAIERDLKDAIEAFLMAQPERKRRVFIARYFRHASVEEISKQTGRSVSSVKTELYRLRIELKKYLDEREFFI